MNSRDSVTAHRAGSPASRHGKGGKSLEAAFALCEQIARSHYENFPVASFLVPREKRPYIWSIYAFARIADDVADEGTAPSTERLTKLDQWEEELDSCYGGSPLSPVMIALAETIRRFSVPKKPLSDLLTAFRMDVTRNRYQTFDDLLYYCERSANPVGRLVLTIFGNTADRAFFLSDKICTALQLTNFWQDVSVDWQKGRLYLPLEDLNRFGYTEREIGEQVADYRFRGLLAFEVSRTRLFFQQGKPLLWEALPELRFELRLTWGGGMRILERIEHSGFDVLRRRPRLSLSDKLSLVARSITRNQ